MTVIGNRGQGTNVGAWVSLVLGVLLSAARVVEAQPANFLVPIEYPIGGTPGGIAIDDLNNDSNLDVVATNFSDGTLAVFLGDGNGRLEALAEQAASDAPIRVAPGRFDADDFVDLVASESESNNLFFYKGNGDGTFAGPKPIECGHDPADVRAADMNGDGKLDVVISLAAEGGGSVEILLGNGDGTFEYDPERTRRVNGQAYAVVVGDFVEDGQPDVAATALGGAPGCQTRECGTLAILKGNGDGSLDRSVDFPTGGTPYGIDAGDFDKDGHLDIAVVNSADDTISLHRGDGAGNFTSIQTVPVGVVPETVLVADIDGDTWLDVICAVRGSNGVSVARGEPGGTLGAARTFVGGLRTLVATAADFNADGQFDLVAGNQGDIDNPPPSVSLLLAREGQSYVAAEALLPRDEKRGAANGDTDGDQQADLVFTEQGQSRAVVVPGGSVPGMEREVDLSINPAAVVAADVNGDHLSDIVAAAADTQEIAIAKAQPGGTFEAPDFVALAGVPIDLAATDVDGDGAVDLTVVTASPPAVWAVFGDGKGKFGSPTSIASFTGLPQQVAFLDFNDDGRIDLAVGNASVNELGLIRNDGGRTFTTIVPIGLTRAPTRIATSDFDADGEDDVVVSAGTEAVVRVFFGNGDGTFTPRPVIALPRAAAAITARDVTGDLSPDLIVSDQGGNRVHVLAYSGARGFAAPDSYLLGLRPSTSTVGDFDGDGRPDLGVAGTAGWFLTNGVAPPVQRSDGNGDGRFSVADLTALRFGRAYNPLGRVENILRGGGSPTAGVDVDGDGIVGVVDEDAMVGRLFR